MIRSSLDLIRKLPSPSLEPGEEIIEKCSGALDVGSHVFSVFRPCNLYLTNTRLIAAQVTRVIRDFRYDSIAKIQIVKKCWIVGKMKPQLHISLKNGKIFFVVINHPEAWLHAMAQFGKMKIFKGELE